MQEFLSLNEVARKLNIPSYRIAYGLNIGLIPEPTTRFMNRRVFSLEDVQRIAEHFGVTVPTSDTDLEATA